jgi:hypothetical protein
VLCSNRLSYIAIAGRALSEAVAGGVKLRRLNRVPRRATDIAMKLPIYDAGRGFCWLSLPSACHGFTGCVTPDTVDVQVEPA